MLQSILVFWPSFIFGILHTIMPCEDKAIFIFYSFGVSRDTKHALKILSIYGSGLFSANMLIGTGLSIGAAFLGPLLQQSIDRFLWNGLSASSLIIAGGYVIYALYRNRYFPHKDQVKDITDGLPSLRRKKRTAFILGLLAGIPPCIFELGIYTYAMGISLIYGWLNGVVSILFFGIGTFIGLFPLAIVGAVGGQFSKLISRIQQIYSHQNKSKLTNESNENEEEELQQIQKTTMTKLEFITASIMILLGVILLILAIMKIDLFPPESLNIRP
jgi:MFS family permease